MTTTNNCANTWSAPLTFGSATIEMPNLANVTTTSQLYYNPTSGLITQGAFSGFNTASNYTVSGNWEWTGGFNVQSGAQVNIVTYFGFGIYITANGAGGAINQSADSISIASTSAQVTITANSYINVICTDVLLFGGSSIRMFGITTETAVVSTPLAVPPSGWNYLIINTSTNEIGQFAN